MVKKFIQDNGKMTNLMVKEYKRIIIMFKNTQIVVWFNE